jgi:DNA polymerase-3 subunit epsilon
MSWHDGQFRGIDFETTGTDPTTDRAITCGLVDVHPGHRPYSIQWLIDPGTDIAPEATEIHGWTRDRIVDQVGGEGRALRVADGKRRQISADGALFEIAGLVAQAMGLGVPVVAANAAFDLTLLEAEARRYGFDTLAARPSGVVGVVDPMVLDKAFDQYRKTCYKSAGCNPDEGTHDCSGCRGGKHQCGGCGVHDRKLTSLYAHYCGRPLAGTAHSAADDALAAVRVAQRLGSLWPQVGRWKLPTLHEHQVTWRREQCASLRAFFDKVGKEHDGIPGEWPVLPTAYDVQALAVAS